MPQINAVGLLQEAAQLIDHIAPLSAIMRIPLLSNEISVKLTYEKYYPDLSILFTKWDPSYLYQNFSAVFYPFPLNLPLKKSIQNVIATPSKKETKPFKLIYHLHGCSDKGYCQSWDGKINHILDADLILLYGQSMVDLFKNRGMLSKLKQYALVGNYRYAYYLKHKKFYDELVDFEIFNRFAEKQYTIIYAPSWKDIENSSSFDEAYQYVLHNVPKQYNLLVKLHPLMAQKRKGYDPNPIFDILKQYLYKPNLVILPDYPLVYPLLEKADIYLGDLSSIGYDFLNFNKPMFFLNHNRYDISKDKSINLYQTGITIEPEQFSQLYEVIDEHLADDKDQFSKVRGEMVTYAFGKLQSISEIRTQIESLI